MRAPSLSRNWNIGDLMPRFKRRDVIPISSSIAKVEGCSVAARWSSGISASVSNSFTGMPWRARYRPVIIPTGPAPEINMHSLSGIAIDNPDNIWEQQI